LLCSVEISVSPELKKYSLGGYPTVRTFFKGKMGGPSFLGNKPEEFVRNFIDNVIKNPTAEENKNE
jgi:hypothetical protein